MKMSKNFRLNEFIKSRTATRYKIDNTPTEKIVERLRTLCQKSLQPARDHFSSKYGADNVRMHITSGYRSKELNKKVKGSKTSFHLYGYAADVELWVKSGGEWKERNTELYNYMEDEGTFTELIWEYGNEEAPAWVHIAYNPEDGRRMIKKIT